MNFYRIIDRWHSLVGRKNFAEGSSASSSHGSSNTAVLAALNMLNEQAPGKHGTKKHPHVGLRARVAEARFSTELVRTDFMGMRPLR